MQCSECGQELKTEVREYNYTQDVGLNPSEYEVLIRAEVSTCDCGESVTIDQMENLHAWIAIQIVSDPKRMHPSGIRYLRRFLGMTQERLAVILYATNVSVSHWESGKNVMSRSMESSLRVRLFLEMLEDPRIVSAGDISIDALKEAFSYEPDEESVPVPLAPPPWMRWDINRRRNGMNGSNGVAH